jgi:hypothetical protein
LGILRTMARYWGDPDGAICDACDKPITMQQLIMDGIVSTLSAKKRAQFHVPCFQFGGYGEPRFDDVASAALSKVPWHRVILAIVGVLLVSSGVAPVGTIGPANASPAFAADAKPLAARSRPEIQWSVLENSDRAAALGLLLLLRGMADSRRGW